MSDVWDWFKRNRPDDVAAYNRAALTEFASPETPLLFTVRPGERGFVEQTAVIDGKFHVKALTVEQFASALAHAANVLAQQMRQK